MSNSNSKSKKCQAENLINQANLFVDDTTPVQPAIDENLTDMQEQRLKSLRDYYIKHIDQFVDRVKIGERETNVMYELANCNKYISSQILRHIQVAIDTLYLAKEKLILAEKTREHRKEYKYRKTIAFTQDQISRINRPELYKLLESESDNRLKTFERKKKFKGKFDKEANTNDKTDKE